MRPSKIILPVLSLLLVSLLLPRMPVAAQKNVPRGAAGAGAETVIFSLGKFNDESQRIEPIVIIRGVKYTQPPIGAAAGIMKKFTDSYFRVGREYRVIFGGGDAGSLTVKNYTKDSCGNLVAEVGAQTTARLGGQVQALAVSSAKIGSGASSRRSPTEAERASALEVAQAVYGQHRVGASLIAKMKTINLTATDIERDGNFELIGTFQIDAGNEVMHNLFIIFVPTASGKFKSQWNWYQKGQEDRKLIDVVDLDGDGTAEVIAESFEIENNLYVIYKRQAGIWRQVYQGGGGGAC